MLSTKMLSTKIPSEGNPSEKQNSNEEKDQIMRSNKKPKRKITHLIFDRNRNNDEQMVDASEIPTIQMGSEV